MKITACLLLVSSILCVAAPVEPGPVVPGGSVPGVTVPGVNVPGPVVPGPIVPGPVVPGPVPEPERTEIPDVRPAWPTRTVIAVPRDIIVTRIRTPTVAPTFALTRTQISVRGLVFPTRVPVATTLEVVTRVNVTIPEQTYTRTEYPA